MTGAGGRRGRGRETGRKGGRQGKETGSEATHRRESRLANERRGETDAADAHCS